MEVGGLVKVEQVSVTFGKILQGSGEGWGNVVLGYKACRIHIHKKLGFMSPSEHRPTSVFKLLGPSSSQHCGG